MSLPTNELISWDPVPILVMMMWTFFPKNLKRFCDIGLMCFVHCSVGMTWNLINENFCFSPFASFSAVVVGTCFSIWTEMSREYNLTNLEFSSDYSDGLKGLFVLNDCFDWKNFFFPLWIDLKLRDLFQK